MPPFFVSLLWSSSDDNCGVDSIHGEEEGTVEVLVEDCENQAETLAMLDASDEEMWLKTALKGVLLLRQPFAVKYECKADADAFADRIRRLGFRCRVWDGPNASDRIKV